MNIYYLAGIICVIFLGIKGIEYKYNKDEDKSFKPAIIDTIYIFISDVILFQYACFYSELTNIHFFYRITSFSIFSVFFPVIADFTVSL